MPSSVRIGGWVPEPPEPDRAEAAAPVTERPERATARRAPVAGATANATRAYAGLPGRPTRRMLIAAAVTAAVAAGVPVALHLDAREPAPEQAVESAPPSASGPAVPWPLPEPPGGDATSPVARGPSATPPASRAPGGQPGTTGTAKPRTPPRKAPPPPPPAPPVRISLEGESSVNSFSGITRYRENSSASGGAVAGWVGNGPNNVVRLAANVPAAGTYTVTLFYISESSRRAEIRVNGGSVKTVDFPPTGDWDTVRTMTFRFTLRAGKNAIAVGNPDDWGPDIDRFTVTN